jgi:hypothetical protein
MSLAVLDFFLAKQHQAMVILHGILFGTFAVVFVGNYPKIAKTVFSLDIWSFLRDLCVFISQFSSFSCLAALLLR